MNKIRIGKREDKKAGKKKWMRSGEETERKGMGREGMRKRREKERIRRGKGKRKRKRKGKGEKGEER